MIIMMIVITLLPQGLNQAHVDPSQRGVPQVQCENNSSRTKSRFPEVMIELHQTFNPAQNHHIAAYKNVDKSSVLHRKP